jgi:cyclohexanecarboxylate-CoA ligase
MTDILFPAQDNTLTQAYREKGYYRDETLVSWLTENAAKLGENPAIISAAGNKTYAELAIDVSRLAAGLQALGLKKGSIIAVQLPNIPEFIISYLAIASIGGVMQTLHMPYQRSELEYLLNDSAASAIICLSKFKESSPASTLLALADSLKNPLKVICLGAQIETANSFNDLINNTHALIKESIYPTDPFVLLYTSGTTSMPKGVPHRYNNFLSNARLCCEQYSFTQKDKLLSVAPMSHLYGLFVYNMTLSCGASSALLPAFNVEAFVETVKTQQPTAIFAAPAHFAAGFQKGVLKKSDFESVNFVCLSGSSVAPELAKEVDSLLLNGKVGQLWGMSELQAGAITRLNDSEYIRCSSSGQPTPGTELKIVNSDEQAVPFNTEGELLVKGLSVFSGYLNNEEETGKSFTQDGWFRTGDMAMFDDDENLIITGRTKHLINRGGVKYNPLEIENIINLLPQVNQCAIIPVEDNVLGEKAYIFVVVNIQQKLVLDDISDILRAKEIAKYKWPEKLIIIESMPLTPTNKIKHEELKKYLLSSQP